MKKWKRERAKMYAKAMNAQTAQFKIERQLESIIQFFGIAKTGYNKLNARVVQIGSWEQEMIYNHMSRDRIKNQIESIRAFFGIDKMSQDISVDVQGFPPIDLGYGKTMNCRCDIDTPLPDEYIKENRDKITKDFNVPYSKGRVFLNGEEIGSWNEAEEMTKARAEKFIQQWKNRHLYGRKKKTKRAD